MRKQRQQGHQHPESLPRCSLGLCSPRPPGGRDPRQSCAMGLKPSVLGGQRRLTSARPIPAGTLGHWEDMGLGLERACVASRCGDRLIFPGAPNQARLSSQQTTCWAPTTRTLGGWSSPGPGLCTRPSFRRNSEQAAEWAVTGCRAGLPLLLQVQCGCPRPGRARGALAVTQQPGRMGSPGRSRGGGQGRQSEPCSPSATFSKDSPVVSISLG